MKKQELNKLVVVVPSCLRKTGGGGVTIKSGRTKSMNNSIFSCNSCTKAWNRWRITNTEMYDFFSRDHIFHHLHHHPWDRIRTWFLHLLAASKIPSPWGIFLHFCLCFKIPITSRYCNLNGTLKYYFSLRFNLLASRDVSVVHYNKVAWLRWCARFV